MIREKFGKMYLLDKIDIESKKPLNELGLEPFEDRLTVKYLKDKYERKSLPIKEVFIRSKNNRWYRIYTLMRYCFYLRLIHYCQANSLNDKEIRIIMIKQEKC